MASSWMLHLHKRIHFLQCCENKAGSNPIATFERVLYLCFSSGISERHQVERCAGQDEHTCLLDDYA